MGLDDLLATLERRESVTPVTPCYPQGVTAKPAQTEACTLVTPVTPQICNCREDWPDFDMEAENDPIDDPQQEARRLKLLAMLDDAPETERAIITDIEGDPEGVILAMAIRGLATFELLIERERYDPVKLLGIIEATKGN